MASYSKCMNCSDGNSSQLGQPFSLKESVWNHRIWFPRKSYKTKILKILPSFILTNFKVQWNYWSWAFIFSIVSLCICVCLFAWKQQQACGLVGKTSFLVLLVSAIFPENQSQDVSFWISVEIVQPAPSAFLLVLLCSGASCWSNWRTHKVREAWGGSEPQLSVWSVSFASWCIFMLSRHNF